MNYLANTDSSPTILQSVPKKPAARAAAGPVVRAALSITHQSGMAIPDEKMGTNVAARAPSSPVPAMTAICEDALVRDGYTKNTARPSPVRERSPI